MAVIKVLRKVLGKVQKGVIWAFPNRDRHRDRHRLGERRDYDELLPRRSKILIRGSPLMLRPAPENRGISRWIHICRPRNDVSFMSVLGVAGRTAPCGRSVIGMGIDLARIAWCSLRCLSGSLISLFSVAVDFQGLAVSMGGARCA